MKSNLLASKLLLVCLTYILHLPLIEAKPGIYITLPEITDKRLPYPIAQYATHDEKICRRYCIKNSQCEAYSISEFERSCHLHELIIGTRPVYHLGFKVYIRKKMESEGYYIYKTHYYRLGFNLKSFEGAQHACKKMSGRVIHINDKEQNEKLLKLVQFHVIHKLFIGLTDKELEGTWIYDDGAAAQYTNFAYNGKWERQDKNCAIFTSNGEWYQENCRNPHAYICEIPMF